MLSGLSQAAQWPPLPGTACHHQTLVPLFNHNTPRVDLELAATPATST